MSFTGNWTITLNAPIGAQIFQLAATAADGVLTGTVTNGSDTAEIKNGKFEGDEASWDLPVKKPVSVTLGFRAILDGDEMSGTAKIGMFGSAKFTGARTP
jgi:hypothetical protein